MTTDQSAEVPLVRNRIPNASAAVDNTFFSMRWQVRTGEAWLTGGLGMGNGELKTAN